MTWTKRQLAAQLVGRANRKHGECNTPEHRVWRNMRERCLNSRSHSFLQYGGRGIAVCDRWASFEAFLQDMGQRPSSEHSLDRIDNDGPYEPNNCRWATRSEQQRNKRNVRRVEWHGALIALADLCAERGLCRQTVDGRLERGWPLKEALSPTDKMIAVGKIEPTQEIAA